MRGSGFTCNVCGAQYKEFVPDVPNEKNRVAIATHQVIAGYGQNIFCPNCLSTARERLIIALLSSFDLSNATILHLSPEKNIYQFLKRTATVITADLSPGFYRTIDGLVRKEDATQFSFKNASFDWVIGNHILEHIPADDKAMAEIFRVLKPGGGAILQVPYSTTLLATIEEPGISDANRQSLLFGQKDHVRIYALDDYMARLRSAGFNVSLVPYEELQAYYQFAIQEKECFLQIQKPATASLT